MRTVVRPNGRRKRAPKGGGRLYKRDATGKEHPADWPGAGVYWLSFYLPNPNGGSGERTREQLRDADGQPITDRAQAEAARRLKMAPYMARDVAETQRQLVARFKMAEVAVTVADDAAHPPLKIGDAAAAYQASERRPDSGPVTLARYRSQWERFARWAAGVGLVFMRDVARDHVKAYVADLAAASFSPSTYNQHVDTLARFWRTLSDEARATVNPWTEVRHKTVDKIERRKRALTLEEASKVIETAEPGDLRDLLILVACTGQRLGDVCQLRWASVDLPAGVIELFPAKTRRRKGEPVFIPILPQARAVLESKLGGKGFVLPHLADRYARDSAGLSKAIQATFARAGIQTRRQNGVGRAIVEAGAHSMRHAFVTLARWAGLPDALIQKITGHSSSRMVDHYTAFDRAMVSRLAQGFASLPTFAALPTSPTRALALPVGPAAREPLPTWAREIIAGMTARTWKTAQTELLEHTP